MQLVIDRSRAAGATPVVAIISYIIGSAGFWGFCGAFIYAAPRWVIELGSPPEARIEGRMCTLKMMVALVVGTMAAAAFGGSLGPLALTVLHLKDDNAICTVIGLFANRLAPLMVDKGSSALDSGVTVVSRVLKALKGTET